MVNNMKNNGLSWLIYLIGCMLIFEPTCALNLGVIDSILLICGIVLIRTSGIIYRKDDEYEG